MVVWLWRLHTGTVQRAILSVASLIVLVRSWVFVQLHLISPAWFDLWLWVADYRRWVVGSYTLHDFVKAHYDSHRIVTTRLLLLLDSIFFDMNGRSVVTVNLLFLAALGILLWRLARTDDVTRSMYDAPPLFWVALISSVAQLDNLIAPFQVQFSITCVCAAGAAWLLSGAAREHRARRAAWQAALAGGLGIVAAFSMASGVLVAPAMFTVLALRRARKLVWAVFAPLSVLGVALFFHHYPRSGHPALLDWHNTVVRVLYVGNFLAAGLTALPHVATAAGLIGLGLFTLAAAALVRDFTVRGLALPRGDAGLVGVGLFVVMCGPAATMTFRLTFGPEGALVARYGTMSLLFAAVLFGLLTRWSTRATMPPMLQVPALLAAALSMLFVFNLPSYDFRAESLRNVAVADAEMVVNNVGVEGPGPIIFGGLDENQEVRGEAGFLHDRRLNMFAPENRLPAPLLARLRGADMAALPVCRGFVDEAYAIDSGAFLLRGWAVDPGGRESARWIAAVDQSGAVLGSARALEQRPDVQAALGLAGAAHGFDVGFRLTALRASGGFASIRVIGVFPGEAAPLCALAGRTSIGPALIEPVRELRDAAPAPLAAAAQVNGWAQWSGGGDGPPGGIPGSGMGGGMAWSLPLPGQWAGSGSVRFEVAATGGHALAVPFATIGELTVRQIGFTMADGSGLTMPMPQLWGRPDWRAAIVPADFLARHPGPVRVDVMAAGDRWVVVAAPILVELNPEWSRLY